MRELHVTLTFIRANLAEEVGFEPTPVSPARPFQERFQDLWPLQGWYLRRDLNPQGLLYKSRALTG